MYTQLRIRQFIKYLQRVRGVYDGTTTDEAIQIHTDDLALEHKYHLGDHPQAVDAVYFNGMNKEGEAVICGVARRSKNVDAFLYLKLDGSDVLLSPAMPDSYLKQNSNEEGEYRIQGLEAERFLPMRTWLVTYKGEMKPRNDPDKRIQVEVDLTWSALWAPFNYDGQMSALSMAKDLAREPWSRDYFKLLQKYHQTHYEQMGLLKGTVTIDGKESNINMPCVRDHTFGKIRNWRNFHRYVLHFIFLENGDCMEIGSVSQPIILSHLTIGYLCQKKQMEKILPVTFCDFHLYQHGEHQILPKDYAFTFKAGGETYVVSVQVNDESSFYIGKDREAKLYERWCSVEVNGVKGWACSEWQYNNVQGAKTA